MWVYRNLRLSRVNLTFAGTLDPKEMGLSYYACIPVRIPFRPHQKVWPRDLHLDFWENLTYEITFESKEMRLSCHAWVLLVARPFYGHNFTLILWPWPPTLTYFWKKKLNLGINFEPKETRISYYACVFIVARPFCLYQIFCPMKLTWGLNSTCLFLMEVWSDRGSTCKFRNARSAFRNLHVDPVASYLHEKQTSRIQSLYLYFIKIVPLRRFGYEISVF